MEENEASLIAARADRDERSFNQSLRQEQDAAYEESLKADREKVGDHGRIFRFHCQLVTDRVFFYKFGITIFQHGDLLAGRCQNEVSLPRRSFYFRVDVYYSTETRVAWTTRLS